MHPRLLCPLVSPLAFLYQREQARYVANLKRKHEEERDEWEHRRHLHDLEFTARWLSNSVPASAFPLLDSPDHHSMFS